MGASVAPQILGIVSDKFALTDFALEISKMYNIGIEQVSMRAGLVAAGIFPVLGVVCILFMKRYFKKAKTTN